MQLFAKALLEIISFQVWLYAILNKGKLKEKSEVCQITQDFDCKSVAKGLME